MFRSFSFRAALFAALSAGPAFADTLHVPAQFIDIQSALDTAADGDTVLVAPGVYVENLQFPPRAIHLLSAAGPGSTVIDGNQAGRVIEVLAGTPLEATIEGFAIANGLSSFGGGIICKPGASITVLGNHIVDNEATYDGGGMFPRPVNVVRIEGNLFARNEAVGQAGGLQAPANGSVIRNNVFVENTASYGGAYFIRVESSTVLENCTFIGNSAPNGAVASGDGQLVLRNCVAAPHSQALFHTYGNGQIAAFYSTLPGGASQPWFGTGCLDADPRFADLLNDDYRLRPTSPGLDAGDPSSAYDDLDGTRNDQGHQGGPAGKLRTAAWYPIEAFPEPRWNTAVAACGGRIYSIAGQTTSGRTRSVLVYDPATDEWTQLADYPGPELRSASAVEMDGYVYLLGGYLYDYAATDALWRFEPTSSTWEQMTSLPAPRLHAGVAAVSGKIYVLGGRSQPAWQYHDTTWVYDPSLEGSPQGSPWSALDPVVLDSPLGDCWAAAVEGEIFTFGSYEPAVRDRALRFSPDLHTWQPLPPSPLDASSMVTAVGDHIVALDRTDGEAWVWSPEELFELDRRNARVLSGGDPLQTRRGYAALNEPYADLPALSFESLPPLPDASHYTAIAEIDGLVYVIGGTSVPTTKCWVFDPAGSF